MRPVRLKRDDVVVDSRNRSGTGFPTCAICWQPVHGYGIEDERKRGDGAREIDVYAECHGKREVKVLSVGVGQSQKSFLESLALLVFFAPASVAASLTRARG